MIEFIIWFIFEFIINNHDLLLMYQTCCTWEFILYVVCVVFNLNRLWDVMYNIRTYTCIKLETKSCRIS